MNRLALLATCLTLVRAQESAADCFASGSIVGAVLGTFFATAITIGLIAYLLWWFHYKRHGKRLSLSIPASARLSRTGLTKNPKARKKIDSV